MATSVCRVCLVGNTRMLNIDNIHLLEMYEKLTDTTVRKSYIGKYPYARQILLTKVKVVACVCSYEKVFNTKELILGASSGHDVNHVSHFHTEIENGPVPSTVCYLCHRQLQRCHRFSYVAQKSNRILQDLLQNGSELTQNMVTRQSQGIYNLSVGSTNLISINIDSDTRSTAETTMEDQVVVKEKEETNESDEMKIEEIKLEMPDENDEISNNSNLSVDVTKFIYINVDSDTGSTAQTIKQEQVVVKEEDKTNGTDEIYIEGIKLEMPDEYVEISNISNNTEPSLNNDNHEHNNEIPLFYCNVCNKCKASKYQLSRHLKLHSRGKSHSCNRCDKAFNCKSDLAIHMLVHTKEKPYSCNRCDKAFNKKCSLARHMLVHTGEKPYSCNRCDKAFSQKYYLATHMLIHTGEKPYSCNRCDKAFTEKSSLKKHMVFHSGVKPFSCNSCNKAFSKKYHLATHMLIHTGEKPYSCNRCDKAFTEKSTLTRHMLVHAEVKPFSCNSCDKAFSQKYHLATHMLIHTGEKPYSCNRCDKAFTEKSTLTRHMLIHTGKKPYSCNRCDKAFINKNHLVTHMLIHTGEKPYSCNKCDKAFTEKSSLKRHMLIHTGEKSYSCNRFD